MNEVAQLTREDQGLPPEAVAGDRPSEGITAQQPDQSPSKIATPAVSSGEPNLRTESDPTEEMLDKAKAGLLASDENDRVIDIPNPEPTEPRSIPYWQKFLDKRTKIQRQDLTSLPSQSFVEQGTLKVDLYSLSAEELRSKLDSASGIGKKLAEKFATVIEDLKEASQGLTVEQRELLFPLNTAADLMSIEGMGMKRANAVAEALGLEVAVKVEPFDPEYDEAGGFDAEPEDQALQDKPQSLDDLKVLGTVTDIPSPPGWDDRGEVGDRLYGHLEDSDQLPSNQAESEKKPRFNTREVRQKILKAISDTVATVGSSASSFFDRIDAAAGRVLQDPGILAMDQAANMSLPKYIETPDAFQLQPETEKKGLLKGFLEKLPSLQNLSSKQREQLKWVGVAAGTVVLTTALLLEGMQFKPEEAKKVVDVLSPVVVRVSASDVLRSPYEAPAIPTADVLRTVPDQSVPPTADVLRPVPDSTVPISEALRESTDRTSTLAQEMASDNNEPVIIAPVVGLTPPGGPFMAPDAATAYNQPPMPDMGSTLNPDVATANKVPVETPVDITASTEQSDTAALPEMLNGKWLKEKLPSEDAELAVAASEPATTLSEARTFMPTVGENITQPESTVNAPESEMSVLDDGILDTECVNFLTALSKKEGTVYNPDGKNICKLIIKYMNHGNKTDWSINTPGVTLTEITNVNEWNKAPNPGDIGTVPPDAVVAGIYTAATNLDSVDDPLVKSILKDMMSYQIKEDDMTDEHLKKVLEYGFSHQVEPPTDY